MYAPRSQRTSIFVPVRSVPEADMAVLASIMIEFLAIPLESCTMLAFTYGCL